MKGNIMSKKQEKLKIIKTKITQQKVKPVLTHTVLNEYTPRSIPRGDTHPLSRDYKHRKLTVRRPKRQKVEKVKK